MKCPTCPKHDSDRCYGEYWPPLCERNTEPAMRGYLARSSYSEEPDPYMKAVLAAVASCPDRGPVLPLSEQVGGSCSGAELSACRAGKGDIPGRVCLAVCLACRAALFDHNGTDDRNVLMNSLGD